MRWRWVLSEAADDRRAAGRGAPVGRTSLQEAVTQRILEIVRETGLEPGDRLPPARTLAEECAVAIPTVREALRRLEATGVVEIRHGSGIYLRSGMQRVVLPNPNVVRLHRDSIRDLLQARILLEPPMAELAATRAGDAELEELGRLLDTARACLDRRDDTALHDVNMRFHRRVAAASGNKVVSQILDSLTQVYRIEQLEILQLYDDRERDYAEHREIHAALRRRDAARARDLMHHHLTGVRAAVAGRDQQPAGPPPTPGPHDPSVPHHP